MKTILFATLFVAALALATANNAAELLEYNANVEHDGKFYYNFELSDGVSVAEQGQQKSVNKDQQGEAVKGQYSWIEDGKKYTISYVADENGFQPVGDHLPTPPPVPESVIKTLEYLAKHPNKETA